jgi:MerR family transcriptional regulator, light-induced transcriptional regulator
VCQTLVKVLYNAGVNARPHLRIGELSRRVGVSADLLRAWERRYGLLQPERSEGGFRLYGETDEARVRLMQQHLANGVSAAQAARLALTGESGEPGVTRPAAQPPIREAVDRLREALERYDELAGQTVLDDLFARYTLDTVLRDVLMPYLRELGERWERGEVDVAQEHYASALIRGRLLSLARGWGRGLGPHAVLAGAPGEQHDLGLIAFGLALRARGWRITYLGQDTPADDTARAARILKPELVVVAATVGRRLTAIAPELRTLAGIAPVAIAGAAATARIAAAVGARFLEGDPVSAADALAR